MSDSPLLRTAETCHVCQQPDGDHLDWCTPQARKAAELCGTCGKDKQSHVWANHNWVARVMSSSKTMSQIDAAVATRLLGLSDGSNYGTLGELQSALIGWAMDLNSGAMSLTDEVQGASDETAEPLRESLQAVEALTRYASGATPDQQRLAKVCQIARIALRTPSEKAFVQLCAPHGKDWLTCPECAKAAGIGGEQRG